MNYLGHLFFACLIGLLPLAKPSWAQETPLLMEGRSTVYQRVLTRPDAGLFDAPKGSEIEVFTPFTPLYVYARDANWIAVGRSASGPPIGWVETDRVVSWNQNVVAAFTPPANRTRQVMFDSYDSLWDHMTHEAVREQQRTWVERIDTNDVPESKGIVGVEPAEHVDIQTNFYLMPILDFVQDRHPLNYEENILMEVATIPLEENGGMSGSAEYDVGIVFVIDTTSSMDVHFPIIQEQVQSLVSRIEVTEVGDRVNFGIVAFRDDNQGDFSHLKYRVREILPLERREDQSDVINALGTLEDAEQSSPGVSEDSFSAVSYALDEIDWSGNGREFGSKYVVLITDAAPKLPGQAGATNTRSIYRNTAEDLQVHAEDRGIAIMSIHLRTRVAGPANHELAARQYTTLSQFADGTFYYPIEGGDQAELAETTQFLITFFKDDVLAADGAQTQLPASDDTAELTRSRGVMYVRYLGRQEGTAAPDIVRSWISVRNPDDPQLVGASFRLMVTRNELATMADLIGEFYAAGEEFQDLEDISTFHTSIREAIVRLSQNPERVINPNAEQSGDVLEFLSDLPYRGQLLRLSADWWANNPGERRVILDGLASKQRAYQRWLTTPDVWVPLYEGAPDAEWVTTLPMELLP